MLCIRRLSSVSIERKKGRKKWIDNVIPWTLIFCLNGKKERKKREMGR